MKEVRFFYTPDVATSNELPPDEAAHCLRVLRLQEGDEMMLMDGAGTFYRAQITAATGKRCLFHVLETLPQTPAWRGHLHLAVAPTKNMDRTEWLAEKATEIGFDELTFLNCQFSERKVIKTERIDKILIAATKQSRKPKKPILNDMTDFRHFVSRNFAGQKFIAHCYDEKDVEDAAAKSFLFDALDADSDALVLVGPEGDFSVDEVKLALANGFRSVSLGKSRLRTETAALVAVHLMNVRKTN